MKISWDKSNEVGVEAIDRQHRRFFEIVNEILGLIAGNKTRKAELSVVISELASYATYHFATEERYFKILGYKDAKLHIKAHDYYCERVALLMEKIDNPRTDMDRLSEEIANFSIEWLTKHMLDKDKRFALWLKKQKQKVPASY